jgi:hypothetical protein
MAVNKIKKILLPVLLLEIFLFLSTGITHVRAYDIIDVGSQWETFEITLTSTQNYTNPYLEIEVTSVFSGPGGIEKTVKGFWDGGAAFKVRFTPTVQGTWTYSISSLPSDSGLTATGTITVGPPVNSHGFVRIDPDFPNSFMFDDGTPYFMFGTTAYEFIDNAMDDPTGARWKNSVDYLTSHDINKIRLFIYPDEYSLPPYSWWYDFTMHKYPDSQPFYSWSISSPDLDAPRMSHWRKLDEMVRYMAAQGMIADLIVFSDQARNYGTNEQENRFARYSLARYAAFPNVIWCSTNEFDLAGKPDSKRTIYFWNQIGNILKDEDPWHYSDDGRQRPLSIHEALGDPGNPTPGLFDYFDSGWATHDILEVAGDFISNPSWYPYFQQITNNLYTQRNPPLADQWGNFGIIPNLNHGMPVVNDEYGYAGSINRTENRQALWGIYVAGGYASMGDCYDDQGRDRNQQGNDYNYGMCSWSHGDFYDMGEAKGVHDDAKHLIDFFTTKGIEYWKMRSSNSLVDNFRTERVYTLADPGNEYVVYSAVGNPFTVALESGKTYDAKRYDPGNGLEMSLCIVSGGLQQFSAPPGRDWVFYIADNHSPSQVCTLTNAYWSPIERVERQAVQLIVEGAYCEGEELAFEVREDDSFGGNNNPLTQPQTVIFSGGTAAGDWTAEYYPDGTSGDPEYYFIATLLSDGSTVIDSQGNALLTVSDDTADPSIPLNLQAEVWSSTHIELSWDASVDNAGIQGYRILRNGLQIATTAVASYHDTGLVPAMAYTYTVSAFDGGGNDSAESLPATATTTSLPDTTPVDYYCDTDIDGHYDNSVSGSCAGGGCEPAGCHVISGTDCNDADNSVNPDAAEIWYDGTDQDCQWNNDYDQDMDGYVDAGWNSGAGGSAPGIDDCDDTNAAISPGAAEIPYDGVDQDCSGADLRDFDSDGHDSMAVCFDDCNDGDPAIHSGAAELWYDGTDQDCQGNNDYDQDMDSYVAASWNSQAGGSAPGMNDCEDSDTAVNPGAAEQWYDGADQDCDGLNDYDQDMDGYVDADWNSRAGGSAPGTDDCNDGDPLEHPTQTWYEDLDGDLYSGGNFNVQCQRPVNYYAMTELTAPSGDCDDTATAVNPGTDEICDNIDNDCDSFIDDLDPGVSNPSTWYADTDADGFGNPSVTFQQCSQPTGYVFSNGDCDDTDETISPVADEVCDDTQDNDCDGLIDVADPDCPCLATGNISITSGQTIGGYQIDLTSIVTMSGVDVSSLIYTVAEGERICNVDQNGTYFDAENFSGTQNEADSFSEQTTQGGYLNAGYLKALSPLGQNIFTTQTPSGSPYPPDNPVENGVKWTSDVDGHVTGVRFYKHSSNTGIHKGRLWQGSTLIANATFINETSYGWQTVYFDSPVAVTAGTTYIVSYHSAGGYYYQSNGYFGDVNNAPLHIIATSGQNGIYTYANASTFECTPMPCTPTNRPATNYNANFWVDVIFAQSLPSCSDIAGREYTKYEVDFPAGTYTVWLRGYAVAGADTMLVGVDGSCIGTYWFNTKNQWEWSNTTVEGTNSSGALSAGTHHIDIWTRQANILIDGIYMTQWKETPTDGAHGLEIDPSNCIPVISSNNHAGALDVDATGWTEGVKSLAVTGDDMTCGTPLTPANGQFNYVETCSTTFFRDLDGDGYGDSNNTVVDCLQPAGHVSDNTDCDDTDVNINPATTWYQDSDNDTYGNEAATLQQCDQPEGYMLDNSDCNDGAPLINPGAAEICDGLDNNCDGTVDEGLTGPIVSATAPADGVTAVALNSSVTIIWNEDVDCSSVNAANITSDSPGWEFSICSGSQAVFTTGGQSGETTYTVTVTMAVTDASGCTMTSNHQFSYTTVTLSVTEPNGTGDMVTAGDPYLIRYTLNDPDNIATVSFYYGADNADFNGTAITGACSAAPEGTEATWMWDTTGVTPGVYYVYGIINYSANGSTHIWTGGGADNLASTAANWSNNFVPQNGDTIIFNGTSAKDCNWDINALVHSVNIDSGYNGIFTINSNLSPTGDFIISDGKVIVEDVAFLGNDQSTYSPGQITVE